MPALRFDSEQEYRAFLTAYHSPQKKALGSQGGAISSKGGLKSEDKAVTLLRAIVASKMPGVWYREFTFHESRGWRLDVGCPELKIGLECDGAVHRIKSKFLRDIEKWNALVIGGWRVVRCTPAQVDSGEALDLLKALVRETQ